MAKLESSLSGAHVHWSDVLVIISYFVMVLGVGLFNIIDIEPTEIGSKWLSGGGLSELEEEDPKRNRFETSDSCEIGTLIFSAYRSKRGSVKGYYLASRNMHWILVGASLFASNIGSGHFVGLAGSGAKSGVGISIFELNAMFVVLILGWIFVPVYMSSGVYTMPEYLKRRFGGQRIRVYLSVLTLLLYIFTKISVDIFAGAIFIKQSFNWDLYVSTIVLLIIAGIFTISGGLTAVIWTDFIQTILMVIGAFILMVKSFLLVGGLNGLMSKYSNLNVREEILSNYTNNFSCSSVPDDALHLFRSVSSPDLPWTGITFGLTISAVWYWCSDQVIVQRALAAKNLSHAKAGTVLAGALKLLPMFLLVFPGMAARVLFPDEIGCASAEACKRACNSESGCTNIAYPLLVINLMPNGLRGLMLSVMLAALMSSLTSIFNSSSTIFAIDIWTRIRKNPSEFELLAVGRIFVVVLIIISILWIPVIEAAQGSQLFHYIQSITSFLAPPVCAVYVLAVSWKRINEKGAFWGLMSGLLVGMIRFIWEYSYTVPPCGSTDPDPRPSIIRDVHYLHFGIILFVIVVIVTIVISLLTESIPNECLHRLTFQTRYSREPRIDIDCYNEMDKDFVEMSSVNNEKVITNDEEMNEKKINLAEEQTKNGEDVSKFQGKIENKPTEDEHSRSVFVRAVYCICGFDPNQFQVNKEHKSDFLHKTHEQQLEDADSIIEKPRSRRICAIFAIILIGIGAFVHGLFA